MLAYLHIPFCDSKCFYCSFNSYTNLHNRIDNYMKSLNAQLKSDLKNFNIPKKSLDTLFIGGGTPSTVESKYYEDIFKTVIPYLKNNAEITSEANPNSATKEWLKGMKNLGVNRFSFGVQSFNDTKLKELNRAHSAKEAIEAVENAHSIGVENLSIDIIYDFYSDTKELLKKDIDLAFKLPINHISSYELTIEKATEFNKRAEVKQNSESLGFFLRDLIVSNGLSQYEVSNYGKYKSVHNLGYWQHKEYLGIGAGAVGYIEGKRYYPQTNVDNYIKNPNKISRVEILTADDILTEKIFLGLRSCIGIESQILPLSMKERADILVNEQKLLLKDNTYYNTDYFLSDELALFIQN